MKESTARSNDFFYLSSSNKKSYKCNEQLFREVLSTINYVQSKKKDVSPVSQFNKKKV